jgi:DNA-binding MarR family transcriptional regulator
VTQTPARPLGDLLQDFVGKVAHRSGRTLTIMAEASVTLQQVILLNRLTELGPTTVSEVAAALGMSLPSVSQMIDRLSRLGVVTRAEASDDRRKRLIELTASGRALLEQLKEARSSEFDIGVASLSPRLQVELSRALSEALSQLAGREGRAPQLPAVTAAARLVGTAAQKR